MGADVYILRRGARTAPQSPSWNLRRHQRCSQGRVRHRTWVITPMMVHSGSWHLYIGGSGGIRAPDLPRMKRLHWTSYATLPDFNRTRRNYNLVVSVRAVSRILLL